MTEAVEERSDNLVRMLVMQPDEDAPSDPGMLNMKVVACEYDMAKGPADGARALSAEETPGDPAEFISMVRDDIEGVIVSIIARIAKSMRDCGFKDDDTGQHFLQLMAESTSKPIELIHNMFASMVVSSAENVAALSDKDYAEFLKEMGLDEQT